MEYTFNQMINHKHKFIFIHIPKTGGTSIEDALFSRKTRTKKNLWGEPNKYQDGGLQHLIATHILNEVGEDIFSNYFKFSFVRNPWDKLVSQFKYNRNRSDLREIIGVDKETKFHEYLIKLNSTRNHVQWDCQHKFLYDDNGKLLVDFIGRFENFQQDFTTICDKIGIPKQNLPHKNKTKREHYTKYYDDETKQIVAEKYAKDIEYFGYEFGE